MQIQVFKKPLYENDSYFLRINNFGLNDDELKDLKCVDEYLYVKSRTFAEQNIDKGAYGHHKDRPAFRNFDKMDKLEGTIYTYAVEDRNDIPYHQAINLIKKMANTIGDERKSTRCVLRMANSLKDYYMSEISGKDVSCLSLIHYYDNKIALMFRASDIENELFPDLITIYEFFIRPVYESSEEAVNIEIFASTGQNHDFFDEFVKRVKNIK